MNTKNIQQNNPLVSVVVITYNSSKYIIEALESTKSQTYQNIELIISDDGSTDDTIELCEGWIDKNRSHYKRIELITTAQNTGTAGNCNRGVRQCTGDWIKIFAGDDILLPDCIEKNINYVLQNPDAEVVFSDIQNFKAIKGKIIKGDLCFSKIHNQFFSSDKEEQLKTLIKENILPAPSSFIKSNILKQYRFNENYNCFEDAPMWLNLSAHGIKLYGFNDATVMYRNNESIMHSDDVYFKRMYFKSYVDFFWNVKHKLCKEYNLSEAYDYSRKYILIMELADMLLNNQKSRLNNIIYSIIRVFVNLAPSFKL